MSILTPSPLCFLTKEKGKCFPIWEWFEVRSSSSVTLIEKKKAKNLCMEDWQFLTLANIHIFLLAESWMFSHFGCNYSKQDKYIEYNIEF